VASEKLAPVTPLHFFVGMCSKCFTTSDKLATAPEAIDSIAEALAESVEALAETDSWFDTQMSICHSI